MIESQQLIFFKGWNGKHAMRNDTKQGGHEGVPTCRRVWAVRGHTRGGTRRAKQHNNAQPDHTFPEQIRVTTESPQSSTHGRQQLFRSGVDTSPVCHGRKTGGKRAAPVRGMHNEHPGTPDQAPNECPCIACERHGGGGGDGNRATQLDPQRQALHKYTHGLARPGQQSSKHGVPPSKGGKHSAWTFRPTGIHHPQQEDKRGPLMRVGDIQSGVAQCCQREQGGKGVTEQRRRRGAGFRPEMFARDDATENKGTPMAKEYDGGDGSELRQGKRQEREEDTSVEAEFEKKGFGHDVVQPEWVGWLQV